MASAQVLPSSRKQELAEAGRRKLEEFRKQKAAERARKASSNNRIQSVDGATGNSRVAESDGAFTSKSNGPVNGKEFSEESHQVPFNGSHSDSQSSGNEYNISSSSLVQIDASNEDIQKGNTSGSVGAASFYDSVETKTSTHDSSLDSRTQGVTLGGSTYNNFSGIVKQASQSYDSATKHSFDGVKDSVLRENDSISKVPPETSGSVGYGYGLLSSYEESVQPTTSMSGNFFETWKKQQGNLEFKETKVSDPGEKGQSTFASSLFSLRDTATPPSVSSGFGLDSNSMTYSARNEINARRARPSFLDSLNIPRASSETHDEKDSVPSGSYLLNGDERLGSSTFQHSSTRVDSIGTLSTAGTSNTSDPFKQSGNSLFSFSNGPTLGSNDFPPPKQNEDFAALEQHIEDLTQEKFSLQRALEASRALAESLASENSYLTDSYNQQRTIVNQLKADMENVQEEIQAQMAELEAFRNEYANARLECNAADERAKLLASEVIGLEEKALRLRSNELKLERELENAQVEMSNYKKKISTLDKDRQDLLSTINALQEEKKVLQSKLRKASSGGKSIDISKSLTHTNDKSTSTEDLATESIPESSEMQSIDLLETGASSFTMLSETLSVNIPADQTRMIQNINTLISELAMEKEELIQSLSSELSQSAKLKELNKELSRKLEAQTQRLELLTAQSMANENTSSARQSDARVAQDIAPLADEGDEVVERVLGWIMKIFPGGPSRRRTSKLL